MPRSFRAVVTAAGAAIAATSLVSSIFGQSKECAGLGSVGDSVAGDEDGLGRGGPDTQVSRNLVSRGGQLLIGGARQQWR